MIQLIAAVLIAAAPPLPVPIDGLRLIPPSGVVGVPGINARQAKLDNQDHATLFLADHVLQWPYDADARVPYPDAAANARVDIWNGKLYLLADATLRVYRLEKGAWQEEKSWPVEMPQPEAAPGQPTRPHEPFLYPMAQAAAPDILLPRADGLWALPLGEDGVYRAAAPLGLWPPPSYEPARDQVIWPPSERHLASPARQGRYRVLMDGPAAVVLTRSPAGHHQARFSSAVWTRSAEDTGWLSVRFPLVPDFVQPCRLNDAKEIHFAGGRWVAAASSVLPMPLYESWVSLDGGEHFEQRRCRALYRGGGGAAFIDIDGDGDRDWITEEPATFDRGERDALNQFLSSDVLDLRIRIYMQEPAGFAANPAMSTTLRISLEAPPIRGGRQFDRYAAGELYQLSGDLNGDGAKDLVVRGQADLLSIYLTRDGQFPDAPDAEVPIGDDEGFGVFDVDQDGRADLLRTRRVSDTEEESATLVHFSSGVWP